MEWVEWIADGDVAHVQQAMKEGWTIKHSTGCHDGILVVLSHNGIGLPPAIPKNVTDHGAAARDSTIAQHGDRRSRASALLSEVEVSMEKVFTCECGCQSWQIFSVKRIRCRDCCRRFELPNDIVQPDDFNDCRSDLYVERFGEQAPVDVEG